MEELKKKHIPCKLQHEQFRLAQSRFDKESRWIKRRWKREQVLKLEKLNLTDPVEFWESVKNNGRKPWLMK